MSAVAEVESAAVDVVVASQLTPEPPRRDGGCLPLIVGALWLFLAAVFVCGARL